MKAISLRVVPDITVTFLLETADWAEEVEWNSRSGCGVAVISAAERGMDFLMATGRRPHERRNERVRAPRLGCAQQTQDGGRVCLAAAHPDKAKTACVGTIRYKF